MSLRVIARLDLKNQFLIKGINLEGLRKIGNPNEFAYEYYLDGIDEIIFIDIVASLYERKNLINVIKSASNNIFIPLTAGGGIRSIADAKNLFNSGADKICINTAAVKNPKILKNLSEEYGSQSIVLGIETKLINNNWEIYYDNGREKTGIKTVEWIEEALSYGIGEILLTSIDKEGTKKGFDIKLLEEIGKISSVPIIISGGMGNLSHLDKIVKIDSLSAIAIASNLHYKDYKVSEIKKYLLNLGANVRI